MPKPFRRATLLIVDSPVHLSPVPLMIDLGDISGAYTIQEAVSATGSSRIVRMVHHLGQVKLQSIIFVIIQVSSGELSCHRWTSLRV